MGYGPESIVIFLESTRRQGDSRIHTFPIPRRMYESSSRKGGLVKEIKGGE